MEEHKDFYLSNQEVGVGILLETGCFFEAPNFSSLLNKNSKELGLLLKTEPCLSGCFGCKFH